MTTHKDSIRYYKVSDARSNGHPFLINASTPLDAVLEAREDGMHPTHVYVWVDSFDGGRGGFAQLLGVL